MLLNYFEPMLAALPTKIRLDCNFKLIGSDVQFKNGVWVTTVIFAVIQQAVNPVTVSLSAAGKQSSLWHVLTSRINKCHVILIIFKFLMLHA